MPYPYDGQLFASREKKFPELIFFVHFYQGNKRALARHIKAVNGLGYDAFAFNLRKLDSKFLIPLTSEGRLGLKHVFAEQIEVLLNMFPQKKIVFAFSNPAASAIEALARRKCYDVTALVCDSGPSARLGFSALRLGAKYFNEKKYRRSFLTTALIWSWSPLFHKDLNLHLSGFPKDFPILSIRGWRDELISPADIDLVFEPHKQLRWIKLSLPEARHLDGLKNYSKEYLSGLKSFLEGLS
jgi:fermentation-respiration switch protein FrsA (DUF1100 family)